MQYATQLTGDEPLGAPLRIFVKNANLKKKEERDDMSNWVLERKHSGI